jgi:hypothetical protein
MMAAVLGGGKQAHGQAVHEEQEGEPRVEEVGRQQRQQAEADRGRDHPPVAKDRAP